MRARLLDEAAVRLEICRFGRSFFDRGYVRATAGNISVRLADGFLITQTDACLGSLDPDRLARLDADPRQAPATVPARRSRCTGPSPVGTTGRQRTGAAIRAALYPSNDNLCRRTFGNGTRRYASPPILLACIVGASEVRNGTA